MGELPPNYREKIYAGVLGKLIGVYLGRPFENWTYQDIQQRLGPVHYYVHANFNAPLVVIDDDVSGTFAFVRVLKEHGFDPDLQPEHVGKTWLNQVIDKRTIFWWGGHGISTEHTQTWIKPPESGSIETNGITLAEQIGAQIFIDGWAMVAPGNPSLAAKLARAAARVSHDGVAVEAAVLWAVMEAQAFVESDAGKLLEKGLEYVAPESDLRKKIADVRAWVKEDGDWERTRQRIEDHYGYEKYCGICHMIPNHAIMIMALLYAGNDFTEAMHIINTSGWDTDCNSGNVGCLVAIVNGLEGFKNDKGLDWRGPLADRAIISSADGGYSINDAVRITYDLASAAHKLAGQQPLEAPKNGAQWHFSLDGSVQGFQSTVPLEQVKLAGDNTGLKITFPYAQESTAVLTQIFTPRDALEVKRDYEMMACPLVSPGQTLTAVVSSSELRHDVDIRIRLKAYDFDDSLADSSSPAVTLDPYTTTQKTITWIVPAELENKPIQQIGIAITSKNTAKDTNGPIYLESIKCTGTPNMLLKRPPLNTGPGLSSVPETMWQYQWVSSIHKVHTKFGPSFYLAQDHGEGLFYTGTREWMDYSATASGFLVDMGDAHGVLIRTQGVNRWYAAVLRREGGKGYLEVVKARDERREVLGRVELEWVPDVKFEIKVQAKGDKLKAKVGEVEVKGVDGEYRGGAAGFLLGEGSICADNLRIAPVS
ncbi:ADP-ribosylglycohydrolase [Bimuria novae-zelandiae CBS 107.79]|uniref:ADP-ribosylglycohydrolase n=1 Tax=Bimuria novae-zelandiae CBS 107.79 TaxID=1447943 RepID=A0A6A5VSX4_9PLEO|nr:ADP-ribosylglycohydrolase [Bimuria novae-zelandiae CBS 107.79]